MKEWQDTSPVVIVPTMYYETPTEAFAKAGVSLIIWANHLIRANISAMQHTASQIFQAQSLLPVEKEISSVKEIFRLQGAAELKAAEKQYLPARNGSVPIEQNGKVEETADQRVYQIEVS
jgi:phosphoenolpyruvate phosphomutase